MNDVALFGGLVRDGEQRRPRLRAFRRGRYHRTDHDVVFRMGLRRPAGSCTATTRGTELLAATKPDLGAVAPLRRYAKSRVVCEEVCVGIAVVRAVVEDLRVTLYKLANVDVILRLEFRAGLGCSLACCTTRRQRCAKPDPRDAR